MAALRPKSHRRRNWQPSGGELLESRRVLASVAGSVFVDSNSDGEVGPGESGLPGVVVYLDDNSNGLLDQRGFGLEPDAFVEGQVLNHAAPSILVTATSSDNRPAFHVTAHADGQASTGQLVFGQQEVGTWNNTRRLRFNFTVPAAAVSLDVIGATVANSSIDLDAFDSRGQLVESVSVTNLRNAVRDRLVIARATKDIAYVVAYVTSDHGLVRFDNLRVDDVGSEIATLTNVTGFYRFDDVPIGTNVVAQQVPAGYEQTSPFPNVGYETQVRSSVTGLNFGNHTIKLGGTAFDDRGEVGTYEPGGPDAPLAAVALYVDLNANGVPDTRELSIAPSSFVDQEVLDFASSGLTMSVVDAGHETVAQHVTAAADDLVDPESKVFAHDGDVSWHSDRQLRVDFDAPASFVQLDFIADSDSSQARGVLQAFTVDGKPIVTETTGPIDRGTRQTLTIERSGHDIGAIIAYTVDPSGGSGRLDNLVATSVDEPVVITDSDGAYELTTLAEGTYRIGALVAPGRTVSFPSEASYEQEIMFGESIVELDFGFLNTNQTPSAMGDLVETSEDTAITIDVLDNDTDSDGSLNTGTVTIVESPLNGTARVNIDGQIVVTPAINFHGRDTLVYSVLDDQAVASNLAVVTIEVRSVNDAPIARADAVTIFVETTAVIEVLSNDIDVDGELAGESLKITQPPIRGVAEVDLTTGTISYTPNISSSGMDTIRYTVEDEQGLVSGAAEIQVNIIGNGSAPAANPDAVTTEEGTSLRIPVLANDADEDGTLDPRTLVVASPPAHGSTTVDQVTGQIEYQPERGFVGEDSFRYIVRDNGGLASDVAVVNISVVQRNFPYQNPINSLDIDGDGKIIPLDALLIINELNSRHVSDPVTGEIIISPIPPSRPTGYFDVTGDGFITSGDAIRIINVLNAAIAASAAAEGEPLDPRLVAAAFADGLDEDDSKKGSTAESQLRTRS